MGEDHTDRDELDTDGQRRDDGGLVDRRHALGLLAGAAGALALAACGGGSSSPAAGSRSTSTAAAAGSTSTAPATTTSTAPTTTVVGHADGPPVAPADQISEDEISSWAARFGRTWKGAWSDDAGGHGTADGRITINPMKLQGTGQLSVSAGFLGAGPAVAPATYEIDLTHVSYTAESNSYSSPQFGEVVLTTQGFGAVKLVCTGIPGHPDIDTFEVDVQGDQHGGSASLTYTITRGSKVTKGAMAASTGARPAAPQLGAANDEASFVSGDYAASLVTAAQLTAATGTPIQAPEANGGKANFQPGVEVSNARAESGDPNTVVQYGIYRSATVDQAKALLAQYGGGGTPLPGLGDGAFAFAGQYVVVLQGKEMAQVQCVVATGNQIVADTAIAKALLGKLGRS